MTEQDIADLLRDIRNASILEFLPVGIDIIGGSVTSGGLLARCEQSRDPDVVKALVLRHMMLSNKDASDSRAIRSTIKRMEGPDFSTLWKMLICDPPTKLVDDPDHPELWEAAFILGQVGGVYVLNDIPTWTAAKGQEFVIARIITHLVHRYYEICRDESPASDWIDIPVDPNKTAMEALGSTTQVGPGFSFIPPRERRETSAENEYFAQPTKEMVFALVGVVEDVPDADLNVDREGLIESVQALSCPEFVEALEQARTGGWWSTDTKSI